MIVSLNDMNVNTPEFVGQYSGGTYPAAVSPETLPGQEVVTVTAHDRDGTVPNNVVSTNLIGAHLFSGLYDYIPEA